ncbi:MAG: aminotransferase class V-fold PLP-dependent enzyme [Chloroflexota bacterium]|nr:aminotransferase class V-fold PLP-dependent enzyme [Chloroflexota bacterium]
MTVNGYQAPPSGPDEIHRDSTTSTDLRTAGRGVTDRLAPNGHHIASNGLAGSIADATSFQTAIPRSFRTRAAHAGEESGQTTRPMVAPIFQSSVYAFSDPSHVDACRLADPPQPVYSRDGLPNAVALERAVAELEGAAAAHATASGMAAIALVFLSHLSAGDHALVAADGYCDTEALLTQELSRFGVDTTVVAVDDHAALRDAFTPRTRLLFVETISNPGMRLADLPSLARIAQRRRALLCVDNTFATPALCRPLEHGADLVVHSATKFLGGHHDLTAGIVAGSTALIEPIRRVGYLFGPTLGAMDAWLTVRGIKTLAPRMAWISASAAHLTQLLAGHPRVSAVRYAGYDQAALAHQLLPHGAGGMIALDVAGGAEAAHKVVRALRLIPYAPSLGGISTTVSYPPARPCITSEPTNSATLRLSIGLEDPIDLFEDLAQALEALPLPPRVAEDLTDFDWLTP